MDFEYKNVLIYGYGKSGHAVENVLKDVGINYKIYDKNNKINGGTFLSKLNKKLLKSFDLIVVSPGVAITNKYLRIADNLGIKIIGELEFGFWFTSADVIAVTGTNGKTTTTHLINMALNKLRFKAGEYGNVGTPLSEAYKVDLDYIVCEVSSFQLETTDKFAPAVAVLLNIAEDHLNRHKNMDEYIRLKKSIFKNCDPSDICILNGKGDYCEAISNEISGKIYKFNNESGYHVQDGMIYFNNDKLFTLSEQIRDFTYIDNVLAVVGVLDAMGLDASVVNELEIEKIPHRMEKFLAINGVTYIDDSKATNPHATLKAINQTDGNIILVLGGQDKNFNFDNLIKALPDRVEKVVTFGQCGKIIYKKCKKYKKNTYYNYSLENVIKHVVNVTKYGENVLFSPACASFDGFNNYAERGDFFQKCVNNLVIGDESKK